MSDQIDVKENLAYNYCLLETAVENITADYFNAITPILTNAISNGFEQLKEEHPKNKKFIDKENFMNSAKYKVMCIFPMVIVSMLPHAEYVPHFIFFSFCVLFFL